MIEVKICSGTACFVMGGAELLTIEELLTENEKKKVNIKFVPCLGYCKGRKGKPPFVVINGVVYEKVDIDFLVKIIREQLGG